MNERVYDPVIGRFLSADPVVQAPFNGQSLNRYSYVFNNPLSFTDPSGLRTARDQDCQDNCQLSHGGWMWDFMTGVQVLYNAKQPGSGELNLSFERGGGSRAPGTTSPPQSPPPPPPAPLSTPPGVGNLGSVTPGLAVEGPRLSTGGGITGVAQKSFADAISGLSDFAGDVRASWGEWPGSGSLEANLAAFPMLPILRAESAAAGSLTAIRATYLRGLDDLVGLGQSMRAAGTSAEQSARMLVPLRNQLKLDMRAQGSWFAARAADVRNLIRYGNGAGPTADDLYRQYGSWEKVLEALGRTDTTVNTVLGVGR